MKQTILELKRIMKELATISDGMREENKSFIRNAIYEIKTLCEIIDY